MSARNGDKSRFNRKRKQKIARRKHTRELLERTAKARKTNRTQTAIAGAKGIFPAGT